MPSKKKKTEKITEPLLPQIGSPKDLRRLSLEQLTRLAGEIRELILQTVSRCGGHLAPNLGVVELTLALHYVFNTPEDKLIWDVGHQCYAHKIVTGRREGFASLRAYGGLSGFPKSQESEYDCFNTGHSSTSISAALALAEARGLRGGDHDVIAVIGDGALTGGMAYEALNHAGDRKSKLIVVLNDNKMSIANNVGAMSKYLVRLRTDYRYGKAKHDFEAFLKSIPKVGPKVVRGIDRLKDSLKYFLMPGMIFEELGFVYLGPIDGHNIAALKDVFSRAKKMKEPVLIHVLTEKGKGYAPALADPDKFHGVGAFDLESGEPGTNGGAPSYTKIFSQTLLQLAREDERIVAITAAMTDGTGLREFSELFPNRFYDVGIAEQHALTFAAGLAAGGLKPVAAIYSTFLQRAYDQILHDVCQQKLGVVLAIDRAGLVGEDGPTHHGVFDISYLRGIPGLVFMAPADENELAQMLYSAIAYGGPAAIRYPRGEGRGVPLTPLRALPLGKARLLREGGDMAIFACGSMVYPALEAADILLEHGIKAAVADARFINPLDKDMLFALARATGRLMTAEENVAAGGFGSACLECLSNETASVLVCALPDDYPKQGPVPLLLDEYGLSPQKLAERALEKWWPELYFSLAPGS